LIGPEYEPANKFGGKPTPPIADPQLIEPKNDVDGPLVILTWLDELPTKTTLSVARLGMLVAGWPAIAQQQPPGGEP